MKWTVEKQGVQLDLLECTVEEHVKRVEQRVAYAANYRHLSVLDGTAQPRKVASAQFFLEDNNGPSLNNAT